MSKGTVVVLEVKSCGIRDNSDEHTEKGVYVFGNPSSAENFMNKFCEAHNILDFHSHGPSFNPYRPADNSYSGHSYKENRLYLMYEYQRPIEE